MDTHKKIPIITGLLLIVFLVGSLIFITENIFRIPSNASESIEPKNVKTTNVTDTSFAITWTTQKEATGTTFVSSAGKTDRLYYDDRDTNGKLKPYKAHSITVRDLQPNTTYSFTILSDGKKFTDGKKPYELKTPLNLPLNTKGMDPAYGLIRTTLDTAAEGALIYLTVDGSQELSALSKSSGSWLVPLNQIRTRDLTSLLPTVERMNETISVIHDTGEITATTDSLNDSPVPEMTIGETYDFRRQNAKIPSVTSELALRTTPPPPAVTLRPKAGTIPPPVVTTRPPTATPPPIAALPKSGAVLGNTNKIYTVSLIAPANNAFLPTAVPLIQGIGVPNKFVSISIGITKPVSGSTKVKSDGTWSFTPPRALSAGKQSVTVTTVDAKGKSVAFTHIFEILKSGTQVLGDATPSATLAITATPTPSPTTIIVAVTPVSTLSGEEVPTSGNELPTIILIVIGVGLLLGGLVTIFL